jgi:hypothetical protein
MGNHRPYRDQFTPQAVIQCCVPVRFNSETFCGI